MEALVKSLGRFTWAVSLFGVQQAINATRPVSPDSGSNPATAAFQVLADTATNQLGESARQSLQTVDTLQGRLIDVGFSMLTLGLPMATTGSPNELANPLMRLAKSASTCGYFNLGENTPTGWGPIPRPPS